LRQSPEVTSTSASPVRCSSAAPSRTALDAGRERKEAIARPIGNMRRTDRKVILGRKHEVTSELLRPPSTQPRPSRAECACGLYYQQAL